MGSCKKERKIQHMKDTNYNQLLEDFLGFIRFCMDHSPYTDTEKLKLIVQTISHDCLGTLNRDQGFLPRVNGYGEKFLSTKHQTQREP